MGQPWVRGLRRVNVYSFIPGGIEEEQEKHSEISLEHARKNARSALELALAADNEKKEEEQSMASKAASIDIEQAKRNARSALESALEVDEETPTIHSA